MYIIHIEIMCCIVILLVDYTVSDYIPNVDIPTATVPISAPSSSMSIKEFRF